jgi:hypothetical protein
MRPLLEMPGVYSTALGACETLCPLDPASGRTP